MAAEKGHKGGMNNIAWLYFLQKRNKETALNFSLESTGEEKDVKDFHTLTCIYLWHNQFQNAIETANEFIFDLKNYDEYESAISLFIQLLLAKKQYAAAKEYFIHPELSLKERFKPVYFAMLALTKDLIYAQLPPKLTESVQELLVKIEQLSVDYA